MENEVPGDAGYNYKDFEKTSERAVELKDKKQILYEALESVALWLNTIIAINPTRQSSAKKLLEVVNEALAKAEETDQQQ